MGGDVDPACKADDAYEFLSDGRLVFDPGALMCDQLETVTNQSYQVKGDTLWIDGSPSHIRTLTSNEFVYESKISYGAGFIFRITRLNK